MNLQGPTMTTIPESNRLRNCDFFNSVRKMSYLAYRSLPWYVTLRSEGENLVENLIGNNIFKNAKRKDIYEVEKFGRKKSVNLNHADSILNWDEKYFNLIHVDLSHTESTHLNTENSIDIGSIHDSENINAIEKIGIAGTLSSKRCTSIYLWKCK